jgi:esterase/lipase superfamily enzyme
MERIIQTIESENLQKEMNIAIYGHYGFAMMLFPSTTDDFLENEENGLIESIKPFINKGKCTVFSLPGVHFESWLDETKSDLEKSERHYQYNQFIVEEVLPFIFGVCGGPIPIITCGAAIGAFHAANHYFRRPDIFYGVVSMCGTFNIEHFSKGFFNDNCYFNSPVHYLPNLTDEYWLSFLKSKHHVYLLTGTGDREQPNNLAHITEILNMKGIPHNAEFWGEEWGHNPKTWSAMLYHLLDTKI